MTLIPLAEAERDDFAELLEQLSADQWASDTLCTGWSVHDVVAHVLSYEGLGPVGTARLFLRGRLRFGQINDVAKARLDDRSPAELTALMRSCRTPAGLTAGFRGGIALTDGMIHQQDIRRPLDLPRRIPADRVRAALDIAVLSPALPSRRRVAGLKLVSTDLDWRHGDGPEVRGTGEALLMTVAGRTSALADCTGDGVERLQRP